MGKYLTRVTAWLRALAAYEPAAVSWAAGGGIAVIASTAGATSKQEAGIVAAVSALATLYTAFRARPVSVPAVLGGLATVGGAFAAFGFHPSAHTTAAVAAAVSVILPLLFRPALTPVAAIKQQQHAARPLSVEETMLAPRREPGA